MYVYMYVCVFKKKMASKKSVDETEEKALGKKYCRY